MEFVVWIFAIILGVFGGYFLSSALIIALSVFAIALLIYIYRCPNWAAFFALLAGAHIALPIFLISIWIVGIIVRIPPDAFNFHAEALKSLFLR